MRRYETIIIADPDLTEEDRDIAFEKIQNLIANQEGFLVVLDKWGIRKLAYEIKKKNRGFYVRFDYCGTGVLVNEIERFSRIDDRILKYMTIVLEKDADVEKIKEEMIRVEAEKVEAEKAEAEKAEAKKEKADLDTSESEEEKNIVEMKSETDENVSLNNSEPEKL